MQSPWGAVVRAVRAHQWAKNLLVFVPMVLAHRFDRVAFLHASTAFIAFSACASAVYVFNDILDVAHDRLHPRKRFRPFAAGDLSPGFGIALALFLATAALALAATLNAQCVLMLVAYIVINGFYGTLLKSEPIIDVVVLSGMYGLRLEMGAAATNVPLSPWLLAFALFFFTSRAFVKRYVELRAAADQGTATVAGRGYGAGDADLLASFGPASGYVAVLVLALYMNSQQMHAIYGEGRLLWLLCPLVLYWITRVWLLARRGQLDDDPVVFAITDRPSLVVAALAGLIIAAASCMARLAG